MKTILALIALLALTIINVPSAEAYCEVRAANGRKVISDCNSGAILRYQVTNYFYAHINRMDGFYRHTGGTLWQYYADASCQTVPLIVSYTKSRNWATLLEYAQFVDDQNFYVASQTDIPTAASAIMSTNSLADPATCYSTVGWWDENTPFVFTPVHRKPISHFGQLPTPWRIVVPTP